MGPFHFGTQPRLVNLTFGVVCVYTHSGHGRDRTSMHRGLTPLRLDGFEEGDLAGREPGNRFFEGRDLASLLFLYQPNRPHFIKHAARYNTYE